MDMTDYVRPTEMTGDELYESAKRYFDNNQELMDSIVRAARVMERKNGKVSARFLVEFARWLRRVGWSGMEELLGCFAWVHVNGEDVAAIPNSYSAYVTRYLEARGFEVTKSRSKMDSR